MSDTKIDTGVEIHPTPQAVEVRPLTMIVKCAFCNKVVFATKGGNKEEELASLMLNVDRHVRKEHGERWEEIWSETSMLIAGLNLMQWRDMVTFLEISSKGKETKDLINEELGKAELMFGEYFDYEEEGGDEDDNDDDDEDSDNDEGVGLEEGVTTLETIEEPEKIIDIVSTEKV